jgi:hypothetical protein
LCIFGKLGERELAESAEVRDVRGQKCRNQM